MTEQDAAKIIGGLLNAAYDGALSQYQDGGKRVDVVWSKRDPNKVMSIAEAEEHTDAAIREAWLAITGSELQAEDPVSFILVWAEELQGTVAGQ